jgi:hypothetical protein
VATTAQLSQLIAEILRTGTAVPAEVSQVVLEVLRSNGTEGPLPPTATTQPQMQVVS